MGSSAVVRACGLQLHWRRIRSWHWREVIIAIFQRPQLIESVIRSVLLVDAWTGFGRALLRNVNSERFVNLLATRVVVVDCAAHVLLRSEDTLVLLLTCFYALLYP